MFTSFGSEDAFNLRITRPRCALTVISLMPSSELFVQEAGDYEREYLALPLAEPGKPDLQSLRLGLPREIGPPILLFV